MAFLKNLSAIIKRGAPSTPKSAVLSRKSITGLTSREIAALEAGLIIRAYRQLRARGWSYGKATRGAVGAYNNSIQRG